MRKQLLRTAFVATSLIFAPVMGWAEGMTDRPLPVRTLMVPEASATLERQFFGRITAKDTVSLAFEVGGRIEALDALEGAFLSKGDVIGVLDLGPFERRVERAQLAYEQTSRALNRAEALARKNVASEVRAEDAQTAFDLADVELRDARAALEDAQLFAPFDAQVADRIASAHAFVEPGQPIVRLHDLSEVRVQFDLPERLLREIGDVADVTFTGSLPGRAGDIPLMFREFRAETGEIGQSYTVSLAVEPSAANGLRPGQTMQVRGQVATAMGDLILPSTAIATAADGSHYVVIVEAAEDGLRAMHSPVSVTSPTGSALAVTGVEPGAEIVEVGAHAVADGARVKRYVGLSGTGG
ncbi:MAG: efflux RND transporter periplasmic adaptor subunit [Pseudomonadota bacterium]